jgi:hypothetical protein
LWKKTGEFVVNAEGKILEKPKWVTSGKSEEEDEKEERNSSGLRVRIGGGQGEIGPAALGRIALLKTNQSRFGSDPDDGLFAP